MCFEILHEEHASIRGTAQEASISSWEVPLAKGESAEEKMPEEQEFRQHLRALAVSAVRVLIEKFMCEELDQCVGAQWGECTPNRKGYRNGYYQRDLITSTRRIEDLSVPRDREGQFHMQVFERYGRYEPEVAEALTEMFVSATSTHKVGSVAEKLMGAAPPVTPYRMLALPHFPC